MEAIKSERPNKKLDAVIVGAGFAGLYMLYRLRELGLKARVLEAGDGVGGTWYWNRYPGARCDVESTEYSYSFSKELEQEWEWTERYASQPEILRYLNHVADRFDLRGNIQLNTRVSSAVFNEENLRWELETEQGERLSATHCVMATGSLSVPATPKIPGLGCFAGETFQTSRWPHERVDFTGRRVGVIGTGSSGIQSVPIIAQAAEHLYVFQRTANFSVPANNAPLKPEFVASVKAEYDEIREKARYSRDGISWSWSEKLSLEASPDEREQEFERRWGRGGFILARAFGDLYESLEANDTIASFIREKIRSIVKDPETAERLMPKDYPFGTKRLCVDTDYYATFNRENVTLVDIKGSPIEEITPGGLRTSETEYSFDTLVLATGFDAMTGALLNIDVRGREGVTLKEKWAAGPRTYLGLMTAGFPNLFMITGPGSPSVLSNMVVSIEQHVDWVAECVAHISDQSAHTIEAEKQAEDSWVQHVNEKADETLFPKANSWYLGANVPGKPRVFMPYTGGVGTYRKTCDEVAADNYRGFRVTGLTHRTGQVEPERAAATDGR